MFALRALLQSALRLPVSVGSLGRHRDESSLIEALLSAPAIDRHLRSFGVDPIALKAALPKTPIGSIASVLRIVRATVAMAPVGAQSMEKLFVASVFYGSEKLRSALEAGGLRLGEFVFYLAHGHPEQSADIPAHDDAKGWAVRIVNDNYSPMEFVVGALGRYLQLQRPEATRIMFKIHHEGSQDIPCMSLDKALEAAQQINAEARKKRIPLYAQVVAQ